MGRGRHPPKWEVSLGWGLRLYMDTSILGLKLGWTPHHVSEGNQLSFASRPWGWLVNMIRCQHWQKQRGTTKIYALVTITSVSFFFSPCPQAVELCHFSLQFPMWWDQNGIPKKYLLVPRKLDDYLWFSFSPVGKTMGPRKSSLSGVVLTWGRKKGGIIWVRPFFLLY